MKYFQEFCDFSLGETINLLSIPHIRTNFDNTFLNLSLTSYVHFFSQHARAMQITFDCELHKLFL